VLHAVLRLLLDRGAEIEVKDIDNWTALHLAASNGHLEVAKLLLDLSTLCQMKHHRAVLHLLIL
jgi:ankyrin repeat protein